MSNAVRKIWNIVSTALVVLIVLCTVFLMGFRLLGFKCFTVISGSMQPEYMVGDLIYVKEVNPNSIKAGDDITFILNEDLVIATHRVVRVDAVNQHFYTKGIANDVEDSEPVHFKNVIGVPEFSIPKLGYVANFIQNPPGMYIAIAVIITLILFAFLPDFLCKKSTGAVDSKAEAAKASEENERLKAELSKLKAEINDKKK